MSEPMQAAYVGGVIDTWRNYASIEEEYPSGKRTAAELTLALAYDCLDPDMSHRQVRAMVARWLTQHPDHLQISMASVVWTAVTDNCNGVREWKPSKARKAAAK